MGRERQQTSQPLDDLQNRLDEAGDMEGAESTNTVADLQFLDHVNHPTAQNGRLQAVQRLAKSMGNQALLHRMMSSEGADIQRDDAMPADMAAFLRRGVMPSAAGQDVIGAGGRGGFNAKFDPQSRELIATVNVGFNLRHGLDVDATNGNVTPNIAGLNAANTQDARIIASLTNSATTVTNNFPDQTDRINEVNTRWRWGSGEQATWLEQYRQSVVSAWSAQHFFVNKKWRQLQSSVRLNVNVHEGQQRGDHCQAVIVKNPPESGMGASVNKGSSTVATDQRLAMSSSGVGPSNTNWLRYSLFFENNSDDIAKGNGTNPATGAREDGNTYLNHFIADFHAGYPNAGVPIKITGHASSTGAADYNKQLSEKRAQKVEDFLRSGGLRGAIDRVSHTSTGEEGATDAASWRRVDIQVGSGESQITSAHEFGHMIGLGDEYASPAGGFSPGAGTPVPIGNPAAHDALAQAMGGGVRGAVAENSDSIMSVGNTVRPQHYATFHKALEAVTGEKWEYGGEGDAPGVLPAGPFGPDDTVVV